MDSYGSIGDDAAGAPLATASPVYAVGGGDAGGPRDTVGGPIEGAPLLRGRTRSSSSLGSSAGEKRAAPDGGAPAPKMQFTSGLTARALVVGLISASINSAVNMYVRHFATHFSTPRGILGPSFVLLLWALAALFYDAGTSTSATRAASASTGSSS